MFRYMLSARRARSVMRCEALGKPTWTLAVLATVTQLFRNYQFGLIVWLVSPFSLSYIVHDPNGSKSERTIKTISP